MRKLLKQSFKFIDRSLVKIFTQRRHKVAFVVFLIGLTMIITSHLVPEKPPLIHTVLLEVGIACIIASIAEFVLLEHAIEVFKQEVRHDIKIVSHCEEHQLVDIMPPRKHDEDLAIQEIKSAIQSARGEICIIVFLLDDILNSETLLNDALKHLLERNEDVTVNLLLIDPTSDAARIRVMAEGGSPDEQNALSDAFHANSFAIRKLMRRAVNKNKFKINARFYNVMPNFFMISTPKEVFIEPYHLGRKTGMGASNGGTVPLLRFSADSQMYKFAQLHFTYIWDSLEHTAPPANGGKQGNGYIQIKTVDQIIEMIDRRLDDAERRDDTAPLNAYPLNGERRNSTDRRHQESY